MARRSFRRNRTTTRRKFGWEWAGLFAAGAFLTDEQNVLGSWARVPAGYVDTANSAGIPIQIEGDYTLTRTLISLNMQSDFGAQQSAPWVWSAGLLAWDGISDDPLDIGVLPHPYYDQELDWIWQFHGTETNLNVIDLSTTAGLGAESKAQRKLSNGTGILMVTAFADPINHVLSPNNMYLAWNVRMLLKAP